MAYCDKTDLLTGDIPLAAKYGDGQAMVDLASDEIDAEIGHTYKTPVDFTALETDEAATAAVRPSKLLLKKINQLLASGRILMDQAAGGEDRALQAYGKSMWQEATDLLEAICSGKIQLQIPLLGDGDEATELDNTKLSFVNQDGYSLVENFYNRYSTPLYPVPPPTVPGMIPPAKPYDTDVIENQVPIIVESGGITEGSGAPTGPPANEDDILYLDGTSGDLYVWSA